MIRIVLLGRTGNNLFQYALGRVLAEKHGVPLVMDASWFNDQGWSEVSHFLNLPIKAQVTRRFSVGTRALRKITGRHYWEYRGIPVLKEPANDQSFDSRFHEAPADCMLFGYFQSPLYFESLADVLRQELIRIMESSTVTSNHLRNQLMEGDSVAVHVRRGDYLTQSVFRVCEGEYYEEAMKRMRSSVPGARFFIFSDDPGWCRSAFQGDDHYVIDSGHAASNPLHDLHLMSTASHHIIANSSYSWWAAWLGRKPRQQVLMPDRWYSGGVNAPIGEKRLEHWETVGTDRFRQ